ncbi:MAG TPA: hypothetical protein VGX94_05315 [Terriglobia bacterium]|nr:hypothetical protein [Terriglobia bacterium]
MSAIQRKVQEGPVLRTSWIASPKWYPYVVARHSIECGPGKPSLDGKTIPKRRYKTAPAQNCPELCAPGANLESGGFILWS